MWIRDPAFPDDVVVSESWDFGRDELDAATTQAWAEANELGAPASTEFVRYDPQNKEWPEHEEAYWQPCAPTAEIPFYNVLVNLNDDVALPDRRNLAVDLGRMLELAARVPQ